MKILAIETSCDETGITVLEAEGTSDEARFTVLGNALYSQAAKHADFGGVYPNLAKREHAANAVPLMVQALKDAQLYQKTTQKQALKHKEALGTLLHREQGLFEALVDCLENIARPSVDAIAVTKGPGLEPALWVGVNFARALSLAWDIPIIAVNHLEGHIVASACTTEEGETYTLRDTTFPVLGLLISGGHTELIHAEAWGSYTVLGETRDDAVGEAYDKVARMLGLPYPGGLHIANLAHEGRRLAHQKYGKPLAVDIDLPRPMKNTDNLDFSFSGLKTAVLYLVRKIGTLDDHAKMRIATEFEEAVVDVLLAKVGKTMNRLPVSTFVLGGGVAANTYIRKRLTVLLSESFPDVRIQFPPKGLSTDNAVMIGMAGYLQYERLTKEAFIRDDAEFAAEGRMKLRNG